MKSQSALRLLFANPLRAVLALCVLIVAMKAVVDGMGMHENFAMRGNDDIMRLLSVRDWLAGQGWYDVTQYRLLPPDGVSLHWSRYVDLGIAAIVVPLSWVYSMDTAEQIAAAIWPTLILILTIFVVGFGTQRVFGKLPACFAVLCVGFWPMTADLHAAPGNLDHHNVQLLMMTVLGFAVIWPSRPFALGVTGGIAAAFSLAVGLESLPFIVFAGLALFVRFHWEGTAVARQLLIVFCLVFPIAAVLLMMGQTPPSRWTAPVCDQLGAPALSLIAVAVLACLVPLAVRRWLRSTALQVAATAALTALGVLVAWPMLAGCLDGPYGELPVFLQETIRDRISESRSGLTYFQTNPDAALIFFLPVVVSLLAVIPMWISGVWRKPHLSRRDYALGLLLLMCLFAFTMMLAQRRSIIMAAAVVPTIGGIVVATFLERYLAKRDAIQGLLAIAFAVLVTSPGLVVVPLAPLVTKPTDASKDAVSDCQSYQSLTSLNAVPPGVVLTHINFGPDLIWATHHKGLAAPYHRSAAALTNGLLPFTLDSNEMAAYLRDVGATHLLLCRGASYDGNFATHLAQGGSAGWLRLVPLDDDAQLLFEVLPE